MPLGEGDGHGVPAVVPGALEEFPPLLFCDDEELDPAPLFPAVPLAAPGAVPHGGLLGEVAGLFELVVEG